MRIRLEWEVITEFTTRKILRQEVNWDFLPRTGDWIEIAKGWAAKPVKDVTFGYDGVPTVCLAQGNFEDFDEFKNLLAHSTWRLL